MQNSYGLISGLSIMFPFRPGKISALLVSVCLLFVLSACGQKGDLYHPEPEEEPQAALDSGQAGA